MTGETTGEADGLADGEADGEVDGEPDGLDEGDDDGEVEGLADGEADGEPEGLSDGSIDGLRDGPIDGTGDGLIDGAAEGLYVGDAEGVVDGAGVTCARTSHMGCTMARAATAKAKNFIFVAPHFAEERDFTFELRFCRGDERSRLFPAAVERTTKRFTFFFLPGSNGRTSKSNNAAEHIL